MLLLLLLVSLFLLVMLGFYVFVAAPRSHTHQTFAAFVACLALWTIKDIILWGFSERTGSARWWATSSFVITLLLQFSLVVFASIFPDDKNISMRRMATLFAPGLVFACAAFAGWMWTDVRFVDGNFSIQLTPLAYAFGIYVYILFVYSFALLYKKRRRAASLQQRQQLGAILSALIVTGTLNTLANVLLPLFRIYTLLPIGSVFMVFGVVIYAYAITNFKLFSFQSALDQFRLFPIAYKVALSIAAVAVSSFALLQIPIVWWSFAQPIPIAEAWKRYLVFSCISALLPNLILVALVIRIISRPLRRLTEAAVAVAAGDYGAQVPLRSNDEVGLLAASFNEMSRKMAADIENLRALNEQLIRAEKLAAAGRLAAGVAHEVNNPLASISSLIQILQNRFAAQENANGANAANQNPSNSHQQTSNADDETREYLRLIQTQIARISQVTRDMMDFARARPPQRASVDIHRVIESSIRLASFDKTFKQLRLNVDFDERMPRIFADADQLQQVFLNLLLNARDALKDAGADGTLHIRTRYRAETSEVSIEIEDNGCGIAPEHLEHIFDPFFTTKTSGAGLGLAVCYGIITAHGGRIEAKSDVERGARLRVVLPVSQALDSSHVAHSS
jgi:signal transduction histidine kinase